MEQMSQLQEQENTLQSQQEAVTGAVVMAETEEGEHDDGGLVEVTDATRTFLGAAFSAMMDNEDCKKWIRRIGVPNCDQIRCPKLDGVIKAVLPTDAIKVDSYLSRLQQF